MREGKEIELPIKVTIENFRNKKVVYTIPTHGEIDICDMFSVVSKYGDFHGVEEREYRITEVNIELKCNDGIKKSMSIIKEED